MYQSECKVPEIKELFFIAVYTGLRLIDLVGNNFINIKGLVVSEIKPDGIYRKQEKTQELIQIPIHEDIVVFLQTMIKDKEPHEKLFRFSRPYYTDHIKSWLKECGINKPFKFHDTRRTYGMRLKDSGVDRDTIRIGMGHTDYKTTEIYIGETFANKAVTMAVTSLPSLKAQVKATTMKVVFKQTMTIQGKHFEAGTEFVYKDDCFQKGTQWVAMHSFHYEIVEIAPLQADKFEVSYS